MRFACACPLGRATGTAIPFARFHSNSYQMGLEKNFVSPRLKSARRRKRIQIKDKEKQLLALHREQRQLRTELRNLGYEPLNPPVQKGWKRLFVLREDVRRSPRAEFFQKILDKINTVQYSDTKVFKTKKRKRGRKFYVAREQKLKSVHDYEWQRLKLTQDQAFYFAPVEEVSYHRGVHMAYHFVEPWRFVLKIVPNLITQVPKKDFELERRLAEIDQYLIQHHLYHQLDRLLHGKVKYKWHQGDKYTYANPLRNQPLSQILQKAQEESAPEPFINEAKCRN